ncbi:unnamed protein product [Rotaria sp. Silwood2]|nr:unnamed protein product [Rotaria sp. Silwood2]CAF2529688.1 unnamed protein product [Rotaria sp. Silwood2]CAF2764119.1 unnamed protein product [Rotaria sp. Silwood2]CAF2933122.1 unnamed protein product [Rotaria sp. Silwood2]CAF3884883.1 unnamed protein product [Rotaria sp. Silwood2]
MTLSEVYVYNDANKVIDDYDDQPANFGPSIPSNGLIGYVTLTNPKNACTKVAPPPNVPTPKYRWIALIPRTKSEDMCDFDLKVLNAQNANFSAVIIYNFEDALITMGPHGRDIQIPSTLIMYSDGLSIISNYVYNETTTNSTAQFHVKITTEQLFKFGAYLIPFICIISVSFFGLIGFMLVKCYLQRRRLRRHRLPRSALKQLKIKKFAKGDHWEVCAICLDDFEDGAKIRILPCDHAYHMKCIDPWLLNSRRQCPICKRYVFPNHDNSDEEENTGQAPTEQTPLIQPSNDNTVPVLLRTRLIDVGAPNSRTAINESSNTDDDDDDDDDESSLLRQITTTNHITTNDLVFNRPSSSSENYSNSQLPHVALHESSSEDTDNNTTRTTTTYESLQDSISTSFTTPRAANFFVGSPGGTTDNTNISAHSVIENVSDIETDDSDERMHSVITDVEINPAYIPDDETTNVLRTNL